MTEPNALETARKKASEAEALFETALRDAYPRADRWTWYHALDRAATSRADDYDKQMAGNADIAAAHDAWIKALHAFYLLRDGPGGVLGGHA